mmetsp:Transcript_47851/g.93473  ORF Transcript_47851/g.93473 Transcript_47851/m.93473 type:complete len:293 (-) Transcript_47851:360-1238(-)
MKCIQLVMGPAGSGKSTYCASLQRHAATYGRTVHVANLDPALGPGESPPYDPIFDVRDLISTDDVAAELELGPNGSLIYCMEYLAGRSDTWLREELLDNTGDDDYILIDCPGQIELYTHVPVMKEVAETITRWGGCHVAGVFVLDATFLADASKFISGTLLALSVMVNMEIPCVNVLTKCDMVGEEAVDQMLDVHGRGARDLLEADRAEKAEADVGPAAPPSRRARRLERMTEAICGIVDDYTMVSYVPLDITNEESMDVLLNVVDNMLQYGDDLEHVEKREVEDDDDGIPS